MALSSRDDGFKAAITALLVAAIGPGVRCWRDSEVPENVQTPFAAFTISEDTGMDAIAAPTLLAKATMMLRLYGRTEAQATDMEQAIYDGMHHKVAVNSATWWKASYVDTRGATVNFDEGGGMISASREMTVRLFYSRT